MNQHLLDSTADAHALYCIRNCWWLAKVRPQTSVSLLFPGRVDAAEVTSHFGLPALANLSLVGLPALRRRDRGRGVTLNLVFYLAAATHLFRHARAGDWLATASFLKLFRFLLRCPTVRQRCRCIYEVHQLALLDHGLSSTCAAEEFRTLAEADLILTTTESLQRQVKQHLPEMPVATVGLACGFAPDEQPPLRIRAAGEPFTLGYIGSLYAEQGVSWLLEQWAGIAAAQPESVALKIIGGTPSEVEKLRAFATRLALPRVTIHGAVPPAELGPHLAQMDALVIPSLPVGRMPHVAITKAYDYPGMNLPVLASDLPSITEVLRPEESYSFRAGKVDSLIESLRALLLDPAEARRRAHAAAGRIDEFSWASRAERWWLYTDVVSAGRVS